jgi:hypothetical protein
MRWALPSAASRYHGLGNTFALPSLPNPVAQSGLYSRRGLARGRDGNLRGVR